MEVARKWQNVDGLSVMLGDYLGAYRAYVARLEPGKLPEGALYADAVLDNGQIIRCWEGFLYHVGR